MAVAATETLLKSGEISTMIKQGFLSSPPPSHNAPTPSILFPSTPPQNPNTSSQNAPTVFQMVSQESMPKTSSDPSSSSSHLHRRIRVQARISRILSDGGTGPYEWGPPDVELTVGSADGFRIRVDVHRRFLAARSRFFAEKLGKKGGIVEISECDDVEVYVDVIALMYCGDIRRRLVGEEVKRVLGLLKVSAAIMFDAGVSACLEYLEAVPWSENEEEEVKSVLAQFNLRESVTEVLQRVFVEPSTSSRADAVFLQLLSGILQAKDEKSRRDMKALIFGLLREDTYENSDNVDRLEVSRETLYHLCHKCLNSLHLCLSEAATTTEKGNLVDEIGREADNLQWLVEILINRRMADEFVMLWADQMQLADLHSKVPCMYRFRISTITADLCIAVGNGQILVTKDARFSFLRTWLEALYNDFGWMKRACRNFDKKMLEDGLCHTILTLPMVQQRTILLGWFDRFLKKGDDCPNIQRAFEVWWRRAFIRRYGGDRDHAQLQVSAAIMFDAGVSACLEYLEAVPWSENEEEEVKSVLAQFNLRESMTEVLQRVFMESSTSSRADAVFLQLLSGILQAKDEKSRRDMKALIFGLLREDTYENSDNVDRLEVSRETLYHLCHKCLNSLHLCLSEAATTTEKGNLVDEIGRETDNLQWLIEILINRRMGDEFVMLWADQMELADLHSKVPCMYRFRISTITADLCIAVGNGQILVAKDARFSFLRTWLEALYNDFGWMKRACRNFDKKMLEDGLCHTILTLSMMQQRTILLRWFDRFLKKGDDCPNIQRAFEVWWRRAFIRRYEGDRDQAQLQVSVCDYPT